MKEPSNIGFLESGKPGKQLAPGPQSGNPKGTKAFQPQGPQPQDLDNVEAQRIANAILLGSLLWFLGSATHMNLGHFAAQGRRKLLQAPGIQGPRSQTLNPW